MAHFAEIDENNIVLRVLVTDNNKPNEGLDWLMKTFGGRWLKTSYNTIGGVHRLGGIPYRKNFAAKGYTYDPELDAFIPPRKSEDQYFDPESCLWLYPDNYHEQFEI